MNCKKEKLTNKEFAIELEKRTKRFAINIINLSFKLKTNAAGKVICYRLIKAGTSIGANYREANRSVSQADFKNKISICTKEAAETQYWIELIMESELIPVEQMKKLYEESGELLALFSQIFKTCKTNH
ncbi:four helix bundle protein [bacterium]|nr:four helix bundle protein [bacterium]RQV99119.1 MAG: four helix bundle protein [bacterium]